MWQDRALQYDAISLADTQLTTAWLCLKSNQDLASVDIVSGSCYGNFRFGACVRPTVVAAAVVAIIGKYIGTMGLLLAGDTMHSHLQTVCKSCSKSDCSAQCSTVMLLTSCCD